MYDVIVVGARCAGSPTALQLSRAGYKVLLVDKASFPSDKPLSTHLLIRPACAALKRLGLLEAIKRTGVVSASEALLDMHNPRMSVIAQPPACDATDESLAPRRYLLDQILLEAALAAGAELRSECVLDALLFEDNRVVGARCHDQRTGAVFEERARIVIGADGLNSRVAKSVNAPFTHYVPTQSGVFFSYFSDLPLGNRLHLFSREDRFLTAYPTNDGLSIVVDYFPVDAYQDFHADIERSFYDDFKRHVPEFYERLVAGKRESRFLGTCHQPNYFRKCYGPGWALIGDSAIHHDSINPSGISYALVNSEFLSAAVHEGLSGKRQLDDALRGYEQRCEMRWRPHFDFLVAHASFVPLPPFMMELLEKMAEDRNLLTEFFGLIEGIEECLGFFTRQQSLEFRVSAGNTLAARMDL